MHVMKEWRFVGFDDSFRGNFGCIVGCVTAGTLVEGFMYAEIEVDGLDVTDKIVTLIRKSKFRNQLKCIFLSGITFGGFNIADINRIWTETSIPVIVVTRKKPNFDEIFNALRNVSDTELRIEIIKRAGRLFKVDNVFIQLAGCDLKDAKIFVNASKLKGNLPECLRIAHLVASAIIHGESRGKA